MITNSLLFGFLFKSIGFQFWRQAIWLIGIVVFYKIIQLQPDNRVLLKKLSHYLYACIVILLLFFVKTILIDRFSVMRILYSTINYIYGIAFIGMACFFANNRDRKTLFTFLHWVGIFICVGLIIDSKTPIFAVFQIDESTFGRSGARATFLTENSTTLGVFYNFLLLCTFYKAHICKKTITRTLYFLSSFLYFFGAWVTGSRQIVLIIICSMFIGYFGLAVKKARYFLGLTLFAVIISVFGGNYIGSLVESITSGMKDRYTKESIMIKNDDGMRSKKWTDGAKQLLPENMPYWFLGKGIGAPTDRFAASSTEYIGKHFENTYFALFSEMGFFSWYILLFPIIYFCKLFLKSQKTFFSILMFASLLAYCIICWISPNGAAPQSQMALFLTIGLMLYRDKYDVDYNANPVKI
jgi:hypothetical protein